MSSPREEAREQAVVAAHARATSSKQRVSSHSCCSARGASLTKRSPPLDCCTGLSSAQTNLAQPTSRKPLSSATLKPSACAVEFNRFCYAKEYVFESQYELQSQCKCNFESHYLHILESVCYWLARCVVLQTLCLQVFQVQFKTDSSQVAWQDTKRVIFGLQGASPRPLLTLWEGTPMPPLQANTPASPTLDASPPLQSRKQQEVREQGASPILLIARHQPKIAIACHMHLQSSSIISLQLLPPANPPNTSASELS